MAGNSSFNDAIMHSNNNGSTWTNVSNGSSNVKHIFFDGPTLYSASNSGVLRTSDLGLTWGNIGLGSAIAVQDLESHGNSIIAGTSSGIYLTTDNGNTWTRSTINFQWSASTPAPNSVWTIGINEVVSDEVNLFACCRLGVIKSIDGGNTWVISSNGLPSVDNQYDLFSITELNGDIFVGSSGSGVGTGVYKSSDAGNSWVLASNGLPGTPIFRMESSSPLLYACALGNGIFISTDLGLNWTAANSGLSSSTSSHRVIKAENGNVFTAGGTAVFNNPAFNYSSNFASSWTAYPLSYSIANSIETYNNEVFVAIWGGSCIQKTSDNGANWTTQIQGVEDCFSFGTLLNHNLNLFAGQSAGGQAGCNHEPNGVFIYTGPTSVDDKFGNSTLIIHPNPTTGSLTVDLEEASTGILRVLNSLGQVVLEDEFNNSRELDISLDVPSGVYFLQIESDGQVITKKVVKE
jgi:photosystem II stability/assembly factor-like uncharacterized protein